MQVRPRPLWLLLALVLVAAQAWGLMHRIVHGAHGDPRQVSLASYAHAGTEGVAALFAGHDEDSSSCRLFDPLNHAGLPSVPALVLPLVLSSFIALLQQGEFVARWAAMFDARGPPALR